MTSAMKYTEISQFSCRSHFAMFLRRAKYVFYGNYEDHIYASPVEECFMDWVHTMMTIRSLR